MNRRRMFWTRRAERIRAEAQEQRAYLVARGLVVPAAAPLPSKLATPSKEPNHGLRPA